MTRHPSPSPALPIALLATVLIAGCGEKTAAPTPPPAPAGVAAETAPVVAPPDAGVEPEPPKTRTSLRILVRAPEWLPDLDAPIIESLTVSLRTTDRVLESKAHIRNLRSARQGVAVLLVVLGESPPKAQLESARRLIDSLGSADRVAIGAVTSNGFQLVNDFTADTRTAGTALRHLARARAGKGRSVTLYHGLQGALDAFRGRSLSPLRALVFMSDGKDPTLRRTSQFAYVEAAIRRRAAYHGVRLHAIATGNPGRDHDRLRGLSEGSGGRFGPVIASDPTREEMGAAWKTVAAQLHRRLVIDVTLMGLEPGSHELTVELSRGTASTEIHGTIKVPSRDRGRITVDMDRVKAPDKVLPVGVTADRDLRAEAKVAERAGDTLRAGALWHLQAQASPESRDAPVAAKQMDAVFRGSRLSVSVMVRGGDEIPIALPIQQAQTLIDTVWRGDLARESGLSSVARPRLVAPKDAPKTSPADRPIHQLVLHACRGVDARSCLRELMARRTSSHFFVAPDGVVTQLLDLDVVVLNGEAQEAAAIYVAVSLPEPESLAPQDPTQELTWRLSRARVSDRELNGERTSGWGLTPAQVDAFVPLAAALANLYPGLQPVLPIDLERRETPEALLYPKKFDGIVLRSNLSREVRLDPGPGVNMVELNRRIRLWRLRTPSTDMESWVESLADPVRRQGAVERFVRLGALAVPLLIEVAAELPAAEAAFAVRALGRIGDPRSGKAIAQLLKSDPAVPRPGTPEAELQREVLLALMATDEPTGRELVGELIQALTALEGDLQKQALPWLRSATQTVVAMARNSADLTALLPLSRHADAQIRAQVAMAILIYGDEESKRALRRLAEDEAPWIRILAAREMGAAGVPIILAQRSSLSVPVLADALKWTSPRDPVTKTLEWFDSTDVRGRYALSDLWIHWRFPGAVRALAPKLEKGDEDTRDVVYRTLKGVTGRDFGRGSAAGWLTWTPEAPK